MKLKPKGDSSVLVAHADASVRRVAVYLHGVCGDIDAIRSWAKVATAHFTLVALLADEPCAGGQRYRWTSNTEHQERRIEAALSAVRAARGGQLDVAQRVAIGYSQGALRVLALHVAKPDAYPWLLLGGLPSEPNASRLSEVRALALVSGEREGQAAVLATEKKLTTAGISARLFVLPEAGHGQYGPDAPRVMGEAIGWLFAPTTRSAP